MASAGRQTFLFILPRCRRRHPLQTAARSTLARRCASWWPSAWSRTPRSGPPPRRCAPGAARCRCNQAGKQGLGGQPADGAWRAGTRPAYRGGWTASPRGRRYTHRTQRATLAPPPSNHHTHHKHPPSPHRAQLLEHKFFKTAHDSQYLQKHLLVGLPPAPERVQMMRQGHVSGRWGRAPRRARSSWGVRRCCAGGTGWRTFSLLFIKGRKKRCTSVQEKLRQRLGSQSQGKGSSSRAHTRPVLPRRRPADASVARCMPGTSRPRPCWPRQAVHWCRLPLPALASRAGCAAGGAGQGHPGLAAGVPQGGGQLLSIAGAPLAAPRACASCGGLPWPATRPWWPRCVAQPACLLLAAPLVVTLACPARCCLPAWCRACPPGTLMWRRSRPPPRRHGRRRSGCRPSLSSQVRGPP